MKIILLAFFITSINSLFASEAGICLSVYNGNLKQEIIAYHAENNQVTVVTSKGVESAELIDNDVNFNGVVYQLTSFEMAIKFMKYGLSHEGGMNPQCYILN